MDQRLRGVGRLSADACVAFSVTGPALRAAGVPMDLRRDAAYLAYDSIDFDVPIGEHGDASDRLLVVLEEVRQSLRIVDQCLERLARLGPGAIANDSVGDVETLPGGEATFSVESSTGELSFYLVSDGAGLPRRIRCRPPSFFQAQALASMLVDEALDDLLPIVASVFVLCPECDR